MIKLLSQDGEGVYDIERNNFFICGNKVLISDKVNIYDGKAACLGIYNDEQEAKEVLMKLLEIIATVHNIDNTFYCAKMPPKREENTKIPDTKQEVSELVKEEQEGDTENGGEQRKIRENS